MQIGRLEIQAVLDTVCYLAVLHLPAALVKRGVDRVEIL